jgi:hypothetical protein
MYATGGNRSQIRRKPLPPVATGCGQERENMAWRPLEPALPRRLRRTPRDAAVILPRLASDEDRVVPNWRIVDKAVDAYIRVDDADGI